MALYTCNNCGKKVPMEYEVCPFCQTPRPSMEDSDKKPKKKKKNKKKHGFLKTILILFVVLIVLSVILGKTDDKPQKVGDSSASQSVQGKTDKSNTPEESKDTEKTTFGVGEQVSLNDVIVTLNSVTESNGKQFFEPDVGNVYILCEFTIENNSKKELNISSMLCFDGYVDDYSTSMSITAQTSSDKNTLDGTIAAGKKMNGVIGYEAPADWKEIEIHFTPDFWSRKDIIFIADK